MNCQQDRDGRNAVVSMELFEDPLETCLTNTFLRKEREMDSFIWSSHIDKIFSPQRIVLLLLGHMCLSS
jgi:hypothetical protein